MCCSDKIMGLNAVDCGLSPVAQCKVCIRQIYFGSLWLGFFRVVSSCCLVLLHTGATRLQLFPMAKGSWVYPTSSITVLTAALWAV